jgi:hypothetical protein
MWSDMGCRGPAWPWTDLDRSRETSVDRLGAAERGFASSRTPFLTRAEAGRFARYDGTNYVVLLEVEDREWTEWNHESRY